MSIEIKEADNLRQILSVGDVITLGKHYSVPKYISDNKVEFVVLSINEESIILEMKCKNK